MATPNLSLPTTPDGATNISIAFNEAMKILDAVTQLVVQDRDLTAPPTTTEADLGKRWIVPDGATGEWAGHADEIALCVGADLWQFIAPQPGWRAWVVDEGVDCRYTTGWAPV